MTFDLTWTVDIKVLHGDFLDLNPEDPPYSKVRYKITSNPLSLFSS